LHIIRNLIRFCCRRTPMDKSKQKRIYMDYKSFFLFIYCLSGLINIRYNKRQNQSLLCLTFNQQITPVYIRVDGICQLMKQVKLS